jgi:nucleotide-binding universal stress UspA family protein
MNRMRRILFASDFSSASRPAFAKALYMARAFHSELILIHAVEMTAPVVSAATWNAIEREARAAAQKELDRLQRAARKAGVRAMTVIVEGYAADQIVRVAKARRAHLIVIGTHGRTGFSRMVMGSVATRVIASAPCPVMTVRGKRRITMAR